MLILLDTTSFNSCQGMTLDRLGIDIIQPVFSRGQLYTALSNEYTVQCVCDESRTTIIVNKKILL